MMRMRCMTTLLVAAVLTTACSLATTGQSGGDVPRMSKETLRDNLHRAEYVIIDVRTPKDYDQSTVKIKGAIRENPMDVRFWTPYPKEKTLVLYCA